MAHLHTEKRSVRTPARKIATKRQQSAKNYVNGRAIHAHVGKFAANTARLASTSSLLAFARVAGAGAGFVTQIVLARTLAASALGLFYSVTSLAAVVGLIAAHGYPGIAPRFLARYKSQGKRALVAAFVARARRDATVYVAITTCLVLLGTWLWPTLYLEERLALTAAALSIPANASLRVNGSLAASIRRFGLAYLPDTSIRPFLLLGVILALIASGIALTASIATLALTVVFAVLALTQYALLAKDMPKGRAQQAPLRLVNVWRREATPLIVVALFTYFFADVDILMVTPLLTNAETAAVGLCLKLALLVGFAVQVAHQVVMPDLADARARKDDGPIRATLKRALWFPLAVTIAATAFVALWGEHLLGLFGPEFVSAKIPLVIMMAAQLARAIFGPSVSLLMVIGAQRQNAGLAVAALTVLALSNLVLAPLYGVLGAAIAVAIATLFWLVASAIVLVRASGLRTDALYLLSGSAAPA
jgi:O-antigen/teichoic acid export membrane protein